MRFRGCGKLRFKKLLTERELGTETHKSARRIMLGLPPNSCSTNYRETCGISFESHRIIAARSDPHEPFSPDDSVEYGLGCLSEVTQSDLSTSSLSRKVAQAFAEALPLDNLIEHGKSIPAKEVERDLKAFMASEIRRIAKVRGTSVEASCDVSERTIRMWAKGDRKETSD